MTSAVSDVQLASRVESYSLKLFNPVENSPFADAYSNGQMQVLKDFGIDDPISSSDERWKNESGIHAIGLFHEEEMVGGVKIHQDQVQGLPFFENLPIEFQDRIESLNTKSHSTAEICGLWIAKDHLKKGLSEILVSSGVALWRMTSIDDLFTFASQYTLALTIDLGFEVVPFSNQKVWLPYPTDDFKSYVLMQGRDEEVYVKGVHRKRIDEIVSNRWSFSRIEGRLQLIYEK